MRRTVFWTSLIVLSAAIPGRAEPPAVVELLEDDTEGVLKQLNNDGGDGFPFGSLGRDFREFYSGVTSVRVGPFQRFTSRMAGWNHEIAEKPKVGQYRYLRLAWRREGGAGVMIQLHTPVKGWGQRYFAGEASPTTQGWGPMLRVSDKNPAEWTVVTRDLFADFGAGAITGLALTPMEGGTAAWYDHLILGRTLEDLDRHTEAAFGRKALTEALKPDQLDSLWNDLASRDVKVAGKAVRTLVAGRKESVAFLKEKAPKRGAAIDEKQIAKLIADLDDDRFRIRETAFAELERIGAAAVPLLEKAAAAVTAPEAKRRIADLLAKHKPQAGELAGDDLRLLRVLRVLEWSRTPESIKVLESLAKEPLPAGLHADAARALKRARKPVTP